jgi:cytochrome c oxidase subunit 2
MESLIVAASSFASTIDNVILVVAILGGFWFFVAEGVLFYFIFKYRRAKNPTAGYITGEKKEEMKWIHLPHNLIIFCDLFIIFFAVRSWYIVKQDLPPPDETIRVIGRQWSWLIVHPGADKTIGTADDVEMVDELRLKVDTTYHFKLESIDVLHNFSIPVFRLKQDAIPGRVITGWFKPTKVGRYDLQCAEICGIGHGIMMGEVLVESEEDHNKWLQAKKDMASN